jgi:hypothetical protein
MFVFDKYPVPLPYLQESIDKMKDIFLFYTRQAFAIKYKGETHHHQQIESIQENPKYLAGQPS